MTDEAKALVDRLRNLICHGNLTCDTLGDCDAAADLIETQAREIERLRDALQFYARENSWKSCGMYMSGRPNPSSAEIDRGSKARAALAGDSHD